jgi:Met-zincin
MLLSATSTREGEPYKDLEELHERLMQQWTREMNHVANVVGGFNSQTKHIGQDGVLYSVIPKERQAEAVKFLGDNAFKAPKFALDLDVLRRIEPVGALNRIRNSQQSVLSTLLQPARLQRMIEQEALDGAAAYRPVDFLSDLRRALWTELDALQVNIDPYRRNLQRTHLDLIADRLNGRTPVNDDQRAYYRGELRALTASITVAIPKASNRPTRLHLEDSRDQIAKILDPKFVPPAAGQGARGATPEDLRNH